MQLCMREVLDLPTFAELEDAEVDFICEVLIRAISVCR